MCQLCKYFGGIGFDKDCKKTVTLLRSKQILLPARTGPHKDAPKTVLSISHLKCVNSPRVFSV